MSELYLYDDAKARTFEPFALTRPAASLIVGASPIWTRWRTALHCGIAGCVGAPHLDGFEDGFTRGTDTAPRMAGGVIPADSVIANARFAPALEIVDLRDVEASGQACRDLSLDPAIGIWRADDRIAAVRTTSEMRVEELRDGAPALERLASSGAKEESIRGWWIDEIWDLLRLLPEMLGDDLRQFARGPSGRGWSPKRFAGPPSHATVVGEHPVLLGMPIEDRDGVTKFPAPVIEPHVVLDATAGPIVIMHGAHVHAFTRLTGPCRIGDGTTVLGGDLTACSIGPVCKVRGEMSNTIMLGYANKGHDGFVGHSVLGRWTNLGAGTITSNLKNTYGAVALWTPDGIRDTGMQFLGTLFGDHAKTGIGTRLTTGTVLGAGANVYGSAMPPKAVPPFGWGERPPYDVFRIDKFLAVAERVMARRRVALTDDARRQLAAAHAARWSVETRP